MNTTALTNKLDMWEKRDKAISDGYERFNNEISKKCAVDKDVRIGSKHQRKFWFGYKKHVSMDAQSGMITKVPVTKENVTDAEGAKHVLPQSGAVLPDCAVPTSEPFLRKPVSALAGYFQKSSYGIPVRRCL